MARRDDDYYEDEEPFDFGSLPEIEQQYKLYDLIGFVGIPQDYSVRELFWDLMYDNTLLPEQRMAISEELNDLIWDEYGIYFDAIWDWEDFREWYKLQ